MTVGDVANLVETRWGSPPQWVSAGEADLHEASLLALDSTHTVHLLNWRSLLGFHEAVEWTVDWYQSVRNGMTARDCTAEQVHAFDQRRP